MASLTSRLPNRRRVEGSTYNLIYVDETRETMWTLIQTLMTRCRATTDLGKEQPLRIIFTSNPSPKRHWMRAKFVTEPVPEWRLFHQPSGLSPDAENMRYLPKNYYTDMVATSDPSFVKVHVESQWGEEIVGAAVVPEFREGVHVSKESLQYAPGIPLVLGIDGGPTVYPGALVAQVVPIEDNQGKMIGRQLRVLHEWWGENMGAQRAAQELRRDVEWRFGNLEVRLATIDPAASNQKEMGNETIFTDLWKAGTGWKIVPCKTNKLSVRIEGLRSIFQRLSAGQPAILIDPCCEKLIAALAGEYRWKQTVGPLGMTVSETEIDKNNRPYADIGDAAGYLVLVTRATGQQRSGVN